MSRSHQENIEAWPSTGSAYSQRPEAAPSLWPVTSCVSSPCANRAGSQNGFRAATAGQQTPADPSRSLTPQHGDAARSQQFAVTHGRPSTPLRGCILPESNSIIAACKHDTPMHHANKENATSPDRSTQPLDTAPAAGDMAGVTKSDMHIDSSSSVHIEIPLQQPVQHAGMHQTHIHSSSCPHRGMTSQQIVHQADMPQTDVLMQDAIALVTSHVGQDKSICQAAAGTPAHHSMQLRPSSKQYQHPKPRPSSAQVSSHTNMPHAYKAPQGHLSLPVCVHVRAEVNFETVWQVNRAYLSSFS